MYKSGFYPLNRHLLVSLTPVYKSGKGENRDLAALSGQTLTNDAERHDAEGRLFRKVPAESLVHHGYATND